MIALLLTAFFQVHDISGLGYTKVIYEATTRAEASEQLKPNCDVFKEVDKEIYRVICKRAKAKDIIQGE
jgi:hypothetical protein